MCESGSEWEKSPRGKIIQIFFFYYFRFLFLLGRKTSQKKSLFYWYQKVFDLQCVETLPLRFEVLWLILESLWETELVRQLGLIDDCSQLLSSTAWFSWDSRNFKVQHAKWEWKAPREELPAWRGVVVWWVWSQRSVSWTRTRPGSNPHPQILHLYTLSYSVTDIRRWFLGGFDSSLDFSRGQKKI